MRAVRAIFLFAASLHFGDRHRLRHVYGYGFGYGYIGRFHGASSQRARMVREVGGVGTFHDEDDRRVERATLNWCEGFVAELGLCPWARASLSHQDEAMRMVVVRDADADTLEEAVHDAAVLFMERYLTPTTSGNESHSYNHYIINNAISFVIFPGYQDDFEDFVSQVYDLEDTLNDSDEPCPVTIAPFHPQWRFQDNTGDSDDENPVDERAIDYEKRSPYPTVSIVSTEAIEQGGGSVKTSQIADHNEEVLARVGVPKLRRLFEKVYV